MGNTKDPKSEKLDQELTPKFQVIEGLGPITCLGSKNSRNLKNTYKKEEGTPGGQQPDIAN